MTKQNIFNLIKNNHNIPDDCLRIKHIQTGREFYLGSSGAEIDKTSMTEGNFEKVKKFPNNYSFVLNIDIPTRLDLDNQENTPFIFEIDGVKYFVYHIIKNREEKIFSSLDTTYLPFFSSLQIQSENFIDELDRKTDNYKSLNIIITILQKFNRILNDNVLQNIIDNNINIPYELYYIDKLIGQCDCRTLHVLNKKYAPKNKKHKSNHSNKEIQRLLNTEKINIQNFAEKQSEYNLTSSFEENLFRITYDFAFYSKQQAETYNKLSEEDIRNLFSLLVKVALTNFCEAESFNYDGKTDFKITNPKDKYEFYIGEFKIWKGEQSIEELCLQAFKKHITGQESTIYMIMLNKNKDFENPLNKCLEYIKNLPYVCTQPQLIKYKSGKEKFYEFCINNREKEVKVIFAMFDIYHNIVK